MRLALDNAPQLLLPVFDCILSAPPPLQQQQQQHQGQVPVDEEQLEGVLQQQLQQQLAEEAAAAAAMDATAAAYRGLELLQLLLLFEGQLLQERMQCFYVSENLLQSNAVQAHSWAAANAARGA